MAAVTADVAADVAAGAFLSARWDLQAKRSRFTEDEEEFISWASKTRDPGCGLPYFQRWKSSVDYSSSVLTCQPTTPTNCDVMLTICLEGEKPVNVIIDKAYNGVPSIHALMVKHFGEDELDPEVNKFEYSCLVAGSEAGPEKQERRVLTTSAYYVDWLMHGHIIDVRRLLTDNT